MTIFDVRRDNLRKLFDSHGGKTNVALKLGHKNASFISQLAGPNPTKKISETIAREIEQTFALGEGAMDSPNLGIGRPVENKPRTEERRVNPPPPAARVNDMMLAESAAAVLEVSRATGTTLSPDKMGHVISVVYWMRSTSGSIDRSIVELLVAAGR